MYLLSFNPLQFEKMACVYEVVNQAGETIFIWYCKADEVLKLERVKRNPNFQREQNITINILVWCNNIGEAQKEFSRIMQNKPQMPELNKTIRFNRYGQIKCNETGQIFRNQAEAVRVLGINQSRLCQHLNRAPGYKSLRGMTFSYTGEAAKAEGVEAVNYSSKAPA